MNMRFFPHIKFFSLFTVSFILCIPGFSQIKDSTLFHDDPIASMLDSLMRMKFFDQNPKPLAANKYNYAPDFIPNPDDAAIESRLKKLDASSPFDLVYNDQVKQYIQMYTMKKRYIVSRMLGLAELYYPMFEQVLDKYNLPLELKHLAVIESALNPLARSRAGAVGLWQFMYGTGKLYNLKITSYVDDRNDPYKETMAAAQYLSFLHDMFPDWQLVIAAYNCGPGNINKAIRRAGGKTNYWEIRKYLPYETQGYVPAFIAANYVMSYAAEHNFYIVPAKRTFFQVDTVMVKQQISFSQVSAVLDIPEEELEFLNPQYKRKVIPAMDGEKSALCLPTGKVGSFVTNEEKIYDYIKKDSSMAQLAGLTKEVMKIHTVQRGEHIAYIARRYKCTVSDLQAWNNLKTLYVHPGQKLTVYVPVQNGSPVTSAPVLASQNPVKPVENAAATVSADGKAKYHTIRNGDSLWIISQEYNVSVDDLKKWNNIGKSYMLLPGQRIKVGAGG